MQFSRINSPIAKPPKGLGEGLLGDGIRVIATQFQRDIAQFRQELDARSSLVDPPCPV
jgi:hypothetical protein